MEGTIGEIRLFAGNFAPRTWAFCDGQLLAVSSHDALFSILGTIYGGDGRTSFALPESRGRTVIGSGHGPGLSDRRLGSSGGSQTNTLSINQIPSHHHTASGTVNPGASVDEGTLSNNPTDKYAAEAAPGNDIYANTANVAMGQNNATITVLNNGGSQPFNNMQPWLALHYIICLYGIYPSRN